MKAPKFWHALISFLAVIILFVPSSCDKGGDLQEENVLVSITGRAQKGQFTKGSQLTAFGLNGKLVATGRSFPGSITDDMGNFAISGESVGPYLELRAEGFYFNELSGELSGPLYLEALLEPSATKANINILTTIIRQRIKELILSGDKYDKAVDKAQQEFLTSLGISLDLSSDFDQMDITRSSDADAFLLALSCMVQVDNSPAQINALLQALADDMKDGTLEEKNVALLWENGSKVSVTDVTENLKAFYQSKGILDAVIPEYWKYLQRGGYGEVLSARIIKGFYIFGGNEYIVIDDSLEGDYPKQLGIRPYGVYLSNESPLGSPMDINDPFEFHGDYSFEVTALMKDGATVTSSVSWMTVEEAKPLGDDRYSYKVNVSSADCADQQIGILSIGEKDYEFIVRKDVYHLSEVDWHVDYVVFDVSDICYLACENMGNNIQFNNKFKATLNGEEHLLHSFVDVNGNYLGQYMLVSREYVFEILYIMQQEIEVACMSFDGVAVGYVNEDRFRQNPDGVSPEVRARYPYLAMRCPFANNNTASPLNKLTIEGKDYMPCKIVKRYCLYAVEENILQTKPTVEISNTQYGSGSGVVGEGSVGNPETLGFMARYHVRNIQMN